MSPTSEPSGDSARRATAASALPRVLLVFALVTLSYVLCLWLVFPGYFDPLYPLHSDFYFSPGLCVRNSSLWVYLDWPRPLGYLTADLLGRLGLQGYILFLVILTLINATLTVELVRRITNRKIPIVLVLLYCFLLFSHPQFYVNYIHDTLATLSYFYLIAGMNAWYAYRRRPAGRYLAICVASFALLAFTKEAYFISAVCFWSVQVVFSKGRVRKAGIYLLASLVAFEGSGLYLNLHSTEPFIQLQNEFSNPYYMSFAPSSLTQVFLYYASRLFTPALALVVLVGIVLLYRRREMLFAAGALVVAGLCALLPHMPLAHHLDPQYAWTAAALVLSPLLFLAVHMQPGWTRHTAALAAGAVVVVPLSVFANQRAYAENRWAIEQERINRNIIASYPRLKSLDPSEKKILVTGLKTPVHPFHVSSYIVREFGEGREWTVLVPRWRTTSYKPPVSLAKAEAVNVSDFDRVFAYNEQGKLVGDWSGGELSHPSRAEDAVISDEDLMLFPALKPVREALVSNPDQWYQLLQAGIIFWEWGRPEKAELYLRRAAELNRFENPYPLFFLGRVRESQGGYEEALHYYEQAVEREGESPNPVFREAVGKIRRKLAEGAHK